MVVNELFLYKKNKIVLIRQLPRNLWKRWMATRYTKLEFGVLSRIYMVLLTTHVNELIAGHLSYVGKLYTILFKIIKINGDKMFVRLMDKK